MQLYRITFDGQPDYVEARDFWDAIAVWKQGTAARGDWHGVDNKPCEPEEPESVERMTNNWDDDEPVVMRRDNPPDAALRTHATRALDLLEKWRERYSLNAGSNLSNDTSECIVALSDALTAEPVAEVRIDVSDALRKALASAPANDAAKCVELALVARTLVDEWPQVHVSGLASARFIELICDLEKALEAKA